MAALWLACWLTEFAVTVSNHGDSDGISMWVKCKHLCTWVQIQEPQVVEISTLKPSITGVPHNHFFFSCSAPPTIRVVSYFTCFISNPVNVMVKGIGILTKKKQEKHLYSSITLSVTTFFFKAGTHKGN